MVLPLHLMAWSFCRRSVAFQVVYVRFTSGGLRVVIGFGWLPLFGIDVVALDRVAHCCCVSHG